MDDKIIAYLAIITLAVLIPVFLVTYGSRMALDRAYEEYVGTRATVMRNEWGTLRHTPEFMCEASIRQWLKECGKD